MRCLALILITALAALGRLSAQEIQSVARTLEAPREAFFENAPLAEFGLDAAWANGKEQRLSEHYLETPLGPAPAADEAEAALQPAETTVDGAEAALGVAIRQNRALSDAETSDQTSNVCEPSLAVRGQEVLYTGNWFAAFSRNGGTNFSYRNPSTFFPNIPGRPFCCDQVAIYVPSHDLMVWFLQYGKDSTGNTIRIAVAAGADIPAERWRIYDFTPQGVGNWLNEWFDYPDLAHSNQYLFVTTNCFTLADRFARSVCLRIPLGELAAYSRLNYTYFDRTDIGSLRPTQGATGTMYVGAHESTGSIRVYSWPDASTSIGRKSFRVQSWVRGGGSAVCPDGRDWLGFSDGRITAAWSAGSRQGFAWTSAQGGSFPYPHIRVAELNYGGGSVVAQPHVWNNSFAFAYPGAATNRAGQVGVCMSYGGNSLYPNSAVGVRNGTSWALASTSTGTHGPDRNRWGDYQTVRVNGSNTRRFAASVFSMSGGPTRRDTVARVVQFDAVGTATDSPEAPLLTESVPTKGSAAALEPVPSVAGMRASKETGFRFSNEMLEANRAAKQQLKSVASAVGVDDLESVPTTNMSVITLTQTDNLEDYAKLAGLPDIGDFFFESPESLCHPDERQQVLNTEVAPWNGNCQLIITLADGRRARGTGWFMSPQVVVTAGHCIHEGDGGSFFPQVEVIPGMNGPSQPFGSQVVAATRFRAASGWTSNGSVADDYGVILLEQPVAGVTSTDPVALSDVELTRSRLVLSGYPADKPTGTQWMHTGPVSTVQSGRLRYMIDTFGGHSGSAVVTTSANNRRVAVGIHNYGGCPNKCTRITSEVLADLNGWAAE